MIDINAMRVAASAADARGHVLTADIMNAGADEIELLRELNRMLSEEREFGAPRTFCGVPIRDAMAIVSAHEKERDDE